MANLYMYTTQTSLATAIYAFMVPMEGVAVDEGQLVADIQRSIRKQIGSFATPQRYLVSA